MTLILTRTSARYALMVTDRKLTRGVVEFDPDANKNVIFADADGVVAIGYTGFAYVASIPMDQWIVQAVTGVTFPEGRRGRGSVPMLMTTHYEAKSLGLRIRILRERLQNVRDKIPSQYHRSWTDSAFDLEMTGFEWSKRSVRPVLVGLSKVPGSTEVALSQPPRNWFRSLGNRFPVRMTAAPSQNVTSESLSRIDTLLDAYSKRHGSSAEGVADQAESLMVAAVRQASQTVKVVGPDVLSILIHRPVGPEPIIRVRYHPDGRDQGAIVGGHTRIPVRVAFSPWIVTPGCIRSPSVFANVAIASPCGPYVVNMEGPRTDGAPGAISSQERPILK